MAARSDAIGAWFTAESFAIAHHSFRNFDSALTPGVALALDQICSHDGYWN